MQRLKASRPTSAATAREPRNCSLGQTSNLATPDYHRVQAAPIDHARPRDPLDLLFERCLTLADRVDAGELAFLDAVDMAWTATEFAGTVERVGPDQIQHVLAAAFMGARRRAA